MMNKLQQGWRSPGLLNYLFLPVSALYLILVKIRQSCYALGVFRSRKLSVPVIVVGGVSVGGSGKSPLVIFLVNYFKSKGFQPGVISRGYGGNSQFWPRMVDQDTNAELVGDEPQMIFEQCGVAVVVGPDRVKNGNYLIQKLNCDILISDDGFQHFALKRTVDIVVIDGESGFGNGWCLPAGPLREPKSAINRADMIVINGLASAPALDISGYREKPYMMSMELQETTNLADNSHRSLSEFVGQSVHAVAGIGNPGRFFSQLESEGIEITRHAFLDHHRFIESDLNFDDDRIILMTEKDGIKCQHMSIAKNIWLVPAKLRLEDGFYERVDALLETDSR